MTDFLSMKGRLNRASYFLHEISIFGLMFVIITQIGLATDGYRTGNVGAAVLFLWIAGIGGNILYAIQTVKRLHDLDRPGSHYWLLLIPFYNIYLTLVLLFKKGTEGSNSYGPDPLMRT
jgi:uncharacterized membrane protein YhaH (DUF805 family)